MIFKFDKSGNMENIEMEGDIQDMARKGKEKDRFNQMDIDVVNSVKEEVMNGMSEGAAGFESLDEIIGDEDMIQQHETELVKEMDAEVDDEKLKQQMRELNMRNMPSLSNLTKMKDEEEENGSEEDSGDEFNETRNELESKRIEKEEKEKKKLARDLKKELKQRLDKLNNSDDKSFKFEDVSCTMRDGKPYKYHLSLSAIQLAELSMSSNPKIYYDESIQRGLKHTANKGDVPIINKKHSDSILKACLEGNINGGCIYLNYAKEYEDELVYDPEERTLSGNGALAINDGAHRIDCCKTWYSKFKKDVLSIKNPNDFYFPITIENLDHSSCCNVFVELNSFGLSVSKTRLAYHDVFNDKNLIAQKIMSDTFRGKIEVISNSLKRTSNCVMTFGTLLKGCSLFSPETKSKTDEVALYLCKFWEEIIELFPKIYGNVSPEVRYEEKTEKTFIGEVMFIHALFGIAVELQFVVDWKDKLKKLTETNYLSRDNDLWVRNITRNEGKLINTSKTQDFVKDQLLAKVLS